MMLFVRSFPLFLATLLLSASSSHALSSPSPVATKTVSVNVPIEDRNCVVVGGGPVGLAAALTLSNPPHCYNVTLLEKTDGTTSVQTYDPTRAYLYLVNPRGLEWIDRFPFAQKRLFELGTVSSARDSIQIEADPEKPIDVNSGRGSAMANLTLSEDRRLRSYWVPRHQMIQLLVETCEKQNSEKTAMVEGGDDGEAVGSIEICSGKDVVDVEENSSGKIKITCSDGTAFETSLVVAADGIDSSIRQCLSKPNKAADSWLFSRPKAFHAKKYKSPSSGLKLKCLQFPPNFTLTNTDGSIIETKSTTIYSIRSINKGQSRISLGLLPVKDPNLVRPANINTRHDHTVWSIKSGPEMKEYFTKSFPRIQWDTIISNDAEWERFAKATGTTYPKPQYSPGSVVVSPKNQNVGVVLVGDACHAFPPDIGQGINAGLNDVVALDRCLKGQDIVSGEETKSGIPKTLSEALDRYQKNRKTEHRALIRLARFGAPYQYKQSWPRDRVGATLWMWNAALRQILNKITFGIVPPIAIVSTFKTPPEGVLYTPYSEIMRKADTTTAIFQGSVLFGLLWKICKRLSLL